MKRIRIARGRIQADSGINRREFSVGMKKLFRLICLLLVFQVLLVACSNVDNNSPLSFDDNYVNRQILLTAPNHTNTFRTFDPIYLELKHNSINEVVFRNNYNLRIFERTNESWVEINEKSTAQNPSDEIIFSPTQLMPVVQVIVVSPDVGSVSSKHQLRVYVSGDMKTGESIQKVAAFVDVTLQP